MKQYYYIRYKKTLHVSLHQKLSNFETFIIFILEFFRYFTANLPNILNQTILISFYTVLCIYIWQINEIIFMVPLKSTHFSGSTFS